MLRTGGAFAEFLFGFVLRTAILNRGSDTRQHSSRAQSRILPFRTRMTDVPDTAHFFFELRMLFRKVAVPVRIFLAEFFEAAGALLHDLLKLFGIFIPEFFKPAHAMARNLTFQAFKFFGVFLLIFLESGFNLLFAGIDEPGEGFGVPFLQLPETVEMGGSGALLSTGRACDGSQDRKSR